MNKFRRKYKDRADYDDFKKMSRPGWTAGYAEYRDGPKPVSLPSVWQTIEVASAELEERAARLLKPWTFSRWENEADVRFGLRLALIDRGNDWNSADEVAASVVNRAFVRLGRGRETRPAHDEGQRYFTTSYENCAWCGGALSERSYAGKRRDRFCCKDHAEKALKYLDWEDNNANGSIVGQAAYRMIERGKAQFRICGNSTCNEEFPIISSNQNQKYCSYQCRDAVARTIPDRKCLECNETFRPTKNDQKFCCPEHANSYRLKNPQRLEKRCKWCNGFFYAKISTAMYCSDAHKKRAFKAAKKIQKPVLTPEMFDGWFIVYSPAIRKLFGEAV